MAFQCGSDDATKIHLLLRCRSATAAMDSLVSLAVPSHDPATETARESFYSVDAEVKLKVALGKLCSFGASERSKGWLPNSRLRWAG